MKLWQWVTMGVWLWMAELGTIETAPRRDRTRPLVPKASTKLFVDRPDFFDYPDSDRASLHAVARFIGEKPVIFIKTVLRACELPERGLMRARAEGQ
ncbi:uncharacterized protein C16orf92 homolog isoform X3 [Mastomys coucha]|uniref:uncharacterized protein C16orf92 homolog isoform X3 n=1 Tax=Mastomys coucha TaxID=35658 RepID=UPI0012623C93|nr:uncharacterized protein C16orf92 homolog isoform X3 [Mastomys coucha]